MLRDSLAKQIATDRLPADSRYQSQDPNMVSILPSPTSSPQLARIPLLYTQSYGVSTERFKQ
jgi:hypothetical protein